MPYEDDYKMWLEKSLIEMNPDWVCDGMTDKEFTHDWCKKYCGKDSDYITPKCLHMYYHHIVRADRKTEQTKQMGDAKPIPLSSRITQTEPQRNMAEDIVESFGFKTESYRQAKAKTEPQSKGKLIRIEDAIQAIKAYLDLCCLTEAKFHKGFEDYNGEIAREIISVIAEPNCSEKPNNCEPQTERSKVKGSERLVKGKDEPQTDCAWRRDDG